MSIWEHCHDVVGCCLKGTSYSDLVLRRTVTCSQPLGRTITGLWLFEKVGNNRGNISSPILIFSVISYNQMYLPAIAESAHLPAGNRSNPKSTSDADGCSAAAGKVTLQSLQQKLMVEAKRKKELTQYEVVRQDVIGYLHKVFK